MGNRRMGLNRMEKLIEGLKRELALSGTTLSKATVAFVNPSTNDA